MLLWHVLSLMRSSPAIYQDKRDLVLCNVFFQEKLAPETAVYVKLSSFNEEICAFDTKPYDNMF